MTVNERIHEAISRIEPLRGDGPNFWMVEVPGWGLSAPTKRELNRLLWTWFNRDNGSDRDGEDAPAAEGEASQSDAPKSAIAHTPSGDLP